VIDDLPVAAAAVRDGAVIAANAAFAELLATSIGSSVGRPLADHIVDDDRDVIGSVLTQGAAARARLRGDASRFVELHAGPPRHDGSAVVLLREVTNEVITARVLREVATATSVIDEQGVRSFGPVGRSLTPGTTLPGSVADRAHPEDLGRALDAFEQVRAVPGARAVLDVRVMDPVLEGHWAEARVQIVNLQHDPEVGGLVLSLDHLDDPEEIRSIARTSGSFLSVADGAPIGIVLTGQKGFPIYFNEAARRLIPGAGVGELDRDWIAFASAADQAALQELVEETPRTGRDRSVVACFETADEMPRWLLVTVSPRQVEDGRVVGLVITLQDVTEEIRAKKQLEDAQHRLVHLASHDALTGLANRAHASEELERRLQRSTASSGAGAVTVLFCDLDGFKEINDRHGHGVGDVVLAEVGARLRGVVRADRPIPDLVARFGGDEFLLLVEGADVDVDELADRIRTALAEPIPVPGGEAAIGVSIGIAVAAAGETAEQVLHRADGAMYAEKSVTNRNSVPNRRFVTES
jgi:diguanylate cyclase (GGDEF)-like protein/PAS domain S-box-containing protein